MRFNALPLSMRSLTLLIIGVVVVVGAAGAGVLIAIDSVARTFGPRRSAVVVGLLIGLPAYAVLLVWVRRRTSACTITFAEHHVRVQVGTRVNRIPYADLRMLRWRTDSDYARAELETATRHITLNVGLATPAPGKTAGLPGLRYEIVEWLTGAGLAEHRSRQRVQTFRRESPIDAAVPAD